MTTNLIDTFCNTQTSDTDKQEKEVEKKYHGWWCTDVVSGVMTSTSCKDSLTYILGMSIFQLTVAHHKKCMFETTVNHEVSARLTLPPSAADKHSLSTISVILSFTLQSSESSSLLVASSPQPPPCSNVVLPFSKLRITYREYVKWCTPIGFLESLELELTSRIHQNSF